MFHSNKLNMKKQQMAHSIRSWWNFHLPYDDSHRKKSQLKKQVY